MAEFGYFHEGFWALTKFLLVVVSKFLDHGMTASQLNSQLDPYMIKRYLQISHNSVYTIYIWELLVYNSFLHA